LSVAVGKTRDVLEALDAGRLVDEPGGLARGDQCLRAIEQAGRQPDALEQPRQRGACASEASDEGREAGDAHQPDRLGRRTRDDLHAGEE